MNNTFPLFSCLQNYTFLYYYYLQNYTFTLYLSFEMFCRHITESGGMGKLKTRGRRVEVSRGGTSERFAPKIFYGAGSSRGQSIFRDTETSRGAKEAKFMPLCTQKGRHRKNINRNRARGARFHLSYL